MGVIVNPMRKTMAEDAALKISGRFYRLVIPTNQLGILAQLMPNLRIMEIKAEGNMNKFSATEPFPYGTFKMGVAGEMFLWWVYDAESGQVKLSDVYEQCLNRGFPDVSVSRLVYSQQAGKLTVKSGEDVPQHVRLVFKSEAVHPEAYAKIMADGKLPMAKMYELLKGFREKLEVPKEMKTSVKPNYLKLLGFYPATCNVAMLDTFTLREFERPGMFIIEEIATATKVKDMVVGR